MADARCPAEPDRLIAARASDLIAVRRAVPIVAARGRDRAGRDPDPRSILRR